MKCGIVGLPNVGKSTLFNALLKKRVALSANYPFATVEPNVGVVAVPDDRLTKLAELVKSEEKMDFLPPLVPAVVEFVDIAGLVKGASTGAGLGNQFLSHIREVDAIIHVLRDFEDENIVREGSENPESDRETIEIELALADLQVIGKLIDNLKNENKKGPINRYSDRMVTILQDIKNNLEQGKTLGKYQIEDEQLASWFKSLPLLSIKPALYVFNVDEGSYAHRLEHEIANENELVISAKIEEELVELSDEERKEYLKELGIAEPGLNRLIKKAYQVLGLISFLTAGRKEIRAWTLRRGETTLMASGVIHTDFMKKFIRAEVVSYGKLMEAGSKAAAKSKGWVRVEGRDYEVKDGDVIEFLIGS